MMSNDKTPPAAKPVDPSASASKLPEVKGTGFLGVLRTLRAHMTSEQFAILHEHVREDTRQLIDHPPSAVAWTPAECLYDILEVAFSKVYRKNEDTMVEIGKKSFGADLTSIYRVFIRIATPEYVADRASKIWETYNRNNGTLIARKPQNKMVELTYSGLYRGSPAYWAYQRGTVSAAIEATGVKSFNMTCLEGAGQQNRAVYRVTWA